RESLHMKCKPSVIDTIATALLVVSTAFMSVWVIAADESGTSTDARNRLIESASTMDLGATGNT
nr:hypothetical protein [Pirellula sp.]